MIDGVKDAREARIHYLTHQRDLPSLITATGGNSPAMTIVLVLSLLSRF